MDISLVEEIVVSVARKELLPRFARVTRRHKPDGSIVTEADFAVQNSIERALRQHWPDTVFLAEEMSGSEQARLLKEADTLWCLDPLDGTSNFAAGVPYFCISLALIEKGEITLGLVYDPLREECFLSYREAQGAFLDHEFLHTEPADSGLRDAVALVDLKRLSPALAQQLAVDPPYASQRSFGSVALDWCWLAAGRCQLYLHGRANIWDYAAGHYIFSRAGGVSSTLDGEPVFLPERVPRSCVGAVDQMLFDAWYGWLRKVDQAP